MSETKAPTPNGEYIGFFVCMNCLATKALAVPRGVPLADHARKVKCPTCGCVTLRPKWSSE